jgi:hypothetical protein
MSLAFTVYEPLPALRPFVHSYGHSASLAPGAPSRRYGTSTHVKSARPLKRDNCLNQPYPVIVART